MPLKNWSYLDSARRGNAADDYFRDLGLDPQNANLSVNGPSGITMALGRATNRMLEGNQGGAGARRLYSPEAQNDFLALHSGSGSVYDNPQSGGERLLAPQWMSPEAGLVRLNATAAYDRQRGDILRSEKTIGRLAPDLQATFGRLSPRERQDVLALGPDQQYAHLMGSSLRPTAPLRPAGGSTISHGDQRGINDFLDSPFRYNPLRHGGSGEAPDGPIPTMKPLSPVRPKTSLPTPEQPKPSGSWFKPILPRFFGFGS